MICAEFEPLLERLLRLSHCGACGAFLQREIRAQLFVISAWREPSQNLRDFDDQLVN